jgi:hypothetical protein
MAVTDQQPHGAERKLRRGRPRHRRSRRQVAFGIFGSAYRESRARQEAALIAAFHVRLHRAASQTRSPSGASAAAGAMHQADMRRDVFNFGEADG